MRYERLANTVTNTLNGAIDASTTTVTVTDGSVFPSEGDFRILIDSEAMLVTARSTNDLTVVRGVDGTTAATHSDTTNVVIVPTASAFTKLLDDVYLGRSDRPPYRIQDSDGTVLTHSDFTWVNQGTSTAATDDWGGITMQLQTAGANQNRFMVINTPVTPWTAYVCYSVSPGFTGNSATGDSVALFLRESSTGKLIRSANMLGHSYRIQRFTDPTTFSAQPYIEDGFVQYQWLKIQDDGTNLTYWDSQDGINWHEMLVESRTAFLAGGPDQIGIGGMPYVSTGWLIHVLSFGFE